MWYFHLNLILFEGGGETIFIFIWDILVSYVCVDIAVWTVLPKIVIIEKSRFRINVFQAGITDVGQLIFKVGVQNCELIFKSRKSSHFFP